MSSPETTDETTGAFDPSAAPPSAERLRELDEALTRFESQKRWQDVIKTLQAKAEILVERADRVAAYERIASIYLERFSNQAEAIKAYESVLELDPTNARAVEFLKGMYEKRRDWDKLVALLRSEAASAPGPAQLDRFVDIARFVTEKVRRPEVCIELWEEVQKRDPQHLEAIGQLAGFYERVREYGKLAHVLRDQAALTEDRGTRSQLLVKLGMIAGDKLNDDALAVEAWRGVLALDPDDRRAQEALKRRFLAMHAWDDLEDFYAHGEKWDELIRVLEREAEGPQVETHTRIQLYSKIASLWADRKQKVDRAARYLEKILELDAANRPAALRLAPIYREAHDAKRLAAVLEVKLAGDPTPAERVATLRDLGALYEGPLKDGERAFARYRDAFLVSPEDPRSLDDLERVTAGTDRWPAVVETVEGALAGGLSQDAGIALRLRLGRVLAAELGRVDAAIAQYREVLSLEAANPSALASLEGLLRETGRAHDLRDVLDRRLELATTDEERRALLYAIAELCENELDDPERAVATSLAIVTEFGDEPGALAALDRLYERLSRWEDLAQVLERRLAILEIDGEDADRVEVKFRLARVLEQHLGRARDALGHYREIIAMDPEHDGARAALENLLRDPDLRGDAARVLEPVYELRGDWEALIRSARILLTDEENLDERVALYRKIGDASAQHLNDGTRAFDAYGSAFHEAPARDDVRARLVALAEPIGAWSRLVALLHEAAEGATDPALARALWLQLADVEFQRLGSVDRAVAAYERVLAQDPADAEALAALDGMYRQAERWPDLLALFRRRLDLAADPAAHDAILFEIAAVHEEMLGDPEASIATYREVLDRDAANPLALTALDRLFTRLGRWGDLADNLQLRLNLAPTPEERTALMLRLAQVREEKMGEAESAIEIHRAVLAHDPQNAGALAALERLVESPAHASVVAEILEPVYREAGAFDRLAGVFEILARYADNAPARVELLHRIAEIQETALDDVPAAFATLARALREDPSSTETLDALDRLSRVLANHAELVATLDERITGTEDRDVRVALHRRAAAVCEDRLEDAERAIFHQRAILDLDPTDLEAASALERLYQLVDRPSDLAAIFIKKAELLESVDERKAYLLRASELFESVLERPTDAIDAYRRILAVDTEDMEALDALIRLFIAHQRWDDLLGVYERKAELLTDPEAKKRLYFEVASVHESELKDNARAIDAYNRVLELDPSDLVAIQRLDHLYLAQENWPELLDILEREATLAEDINEICAYRFRIAEIHEKRLGDTARAVDIYREILEAVPDHEPALASLTAILHGDKAPLAAAGALEPILTAAGRYEGLVDVLEVDLAHAEDPNRRVELLHRIAELHENALDRPRAAFDAYARAVPADPLNETTLENFERLAESLTAWPDVARTYDAAVGTLAEDPARRVDLLLRVAQAYELRVHDAASAIARYRAVLDTDDQNVTAVQSLDRLYEAGEQWAELAEVLRREVALPDFGPDESLALRFRLAQVLEHRLADVDGALAEHREILAAQADHPDTVAALEAMLERGVRQKEAIEILDPIYRMGGTWDKLAAVQEKNLEFVAEPAERLTAMHRLAELYEEYLADAVGAFNWYTAALREFPLDERTQTEVERLASATGSWEPLANVYVDVIEAETAPAEVKQAIGKKLARVHEEELQNLEAAEEAFNFVLEVAPFDPDALDALDRIYTSAGDATRLASVLDRRAQAATDDDAKTEFTFRLAQILQDELNQTDEAIARYRSILEGTNPRHEPTIEQLEQIYTRTERWQDLYGIQQRKLEVAPDDYARADIYAQMARLASEALGRPDDAVRMLDEVLTLRGEDPEALDGLAALHESAARWPALIDVLERRLAAEDDPEKRVAIALRIPAVYLHQLQDVERAVDGYRRVLEIDPNSLDALRALAAIFRDAQQWDDLVGTLQTLLAVGAAVLPDSELKATYAELGTIYWTTYQDGIEAVDAWRRVLDIDPKDETAIESLLAIHTAREEWRDVVDVLGRKADALSLEEARIPVYLQAAQVWEEKLADRDGARPAYEKVLEIDSLHEHAFKSLEALHEEHQRWDDLASLYVARHDKLQENGETRAAVPLMRSAARLFDEKLGDREQAYAAAQIAFEEDVSDAETVAVLEKLAGATSKWNELLQTTLAAYQTETGPRKIQLGLHVAKWYGVDLGHPEWAIPIYTQILQAEPNNVLALQSMGGLYRKLGQWPQLAQILQRCIDVARTDEDRRRAHVELGEVKEKNLAQVEAAIEHYRQALALDAGDHEALGALARVYTNRGEYHPLVDVLRQVVEHAREVQEVVDTRLHIAEILEDRIGDVEAAIEEYRQVLAQDGTNLHALRGLERLYAQLDRPQDLLGVLEAELEVVPTERERIKLLTRIAEMLEEIFVKPDLAIQRFEQIVDIEPSNDGALRGLARLYRQQGRWNDLINTLERHLSATPERRERVPLLEQMGRVYAEELNDLDRAEDAYLNVLQIDAHHAPAMEALARLYERRNDWHRAVEVMEQLAMELSQEPTRVVELRCRIGKIAEEQLQDEGRAMDLYQSALDVDPNAVPALAALRGIHVRRGDWHDAAHFLDREQSVTEAPRARARLLSELGRIAATYLDEPERAIACYQEAVGADPDLEEAALPLVNYYVEQGFWAEAEPLAEMLVRRAGRRDPAEQFQIQFTMGRVAAALGKLDRAAKAFAAAQTLDRTNVEAIRSLARVHFDKGDWENAFKSYQLLLVHHKDELDSEGRADLYFRLGVVKREQGDRRRAVNFLDKALEEYAGYVPALQALVETHAAGNEWDQALGYKNQLLELENDPETRLAMLIELGQLWQEKGNNPQKAIQYYAQAVDARPKDHVLLHKLLMLYQQTRQWSKVVDVVGRISDLEQDPIRKAPYSYTIATIYNNEIKNPDEALKFYNLALDQNPKELKPFTKINEILTTRRDFKTLERNFRSMLHRVAGKGDANLEFTLLHNLGVIYRDRLGQTDAAIKAFAMASERQPENVTEHRILAELHSRLGNTDDAVARWYTILEKDMTNDDALHALYGLYYGARQYDKAWCVAATGAFLLGDRLKQEPRAFYEQYKPRGPLKPTGRLTEEHWVKLLFHANEDPVVGKVFAAVLGALRKAKVQPIARFGFQQKDQHDPATSNVALVKALGAASGALSLPTPWIFLRPDQAGGLAFVPSEPIASFAGKGLLSGLSLPELAFVAGKHMAYYRNEHYVRVLFPTVQEITAIFLAAIKLVKADQEVPPEALTTAQQLGPLVAQDPVAVEGLRKVVRIFLEQGGQSNIKRWYQSVELTAARAGFLLAGDLDVAKKMLNLEPGLPGDLAPTEKLKDLVLFSVSEKYFTLREAMGINFQAAAGY